MSFGSFGRAAAAGGFTGPLSSSAAGSRPPAGQPAPVAYGAPPVGGGGSGSLIALAQQAGFSPEEARIMAAIIMAESGGDPTSLNDNPKTGDLSYGLAQINMLGAMGPQRRRDLGLTSNEQLYDPATNLRAAYYLYKRGGWGHWTVYKKGTYRQYLGRDYPLRPGMGGGVAGSGGVGRVSPGGIFTGTSWAALDAYGREQAKSMFPTLAKAIDAGIDIPTYVEPYRQVAAQLLEIPVDSVDFMEPKWRKLIDTTGPDGQRRALALWEATNLMRTDPIYGYDRTTGARSEAAQLAAHIGRTFGRVA